MKSELTKIEPEKEARYWDKEFAKEKAAQTGRLLDKAEPYGAHRPPR
jgi:hypothetical protein